MALGRLVGCVSDAAAAAAVTLMTSGAGSAQQAQLQAWPTWQVRMAAQDLDASSTGGGWQQQQQQLARLIAATLNGQLDTQ